MVFGQRSRPIRNCPDFSPAVNCPALRGWADCEFQMLNLVADSGLKCDGKPDLLFSAACNHNQMWPVVQESERSQPYCGCIECIFHAPLLVAYLKLSSSILLVYMPTDYIHVLNDTMILMLMKWLYFVVILWLFPQKINAQNAEFSPQFTAPWPLVLLVPRAEQLVSAFSGVADLVGASKRVRHWRDMKRYEEIRYDQNDQVSFLIISIGIKEQNGTALIGTNFENLKVSDQSRHLRALHDMLLCRRAIATRCRLIAILPPPQPCDEAGKCFVQVQTRQAATQAGLAPGQSQTSF